MAIEAEPRVGKLQAQRKFIDQLRRTIDKGRRTIEKSRVLHKETELCSSNQGWPFVKEII